MPLVQHNLLTDGPLAADLEDGGAGRVLGGTLVVVQPELSERTLPLEERVDAVTHLPCVRGVAW